jgi:preprotein translocase subunit SecY
MNGVRRIVSILNKFIPEVEKPSQRPSFKEKLGWTGVALMLYYLLTQIPIYGIPKTAVDYLAGLRVIFAGATGSIVELGIGPVVTAGIVMELLLGSKIIKLDLTDPEDRRFFQESQRVLAIFFILFENGTYALGKYPTDPKMELIIILQMALGSFLLMMLDDLVSKWGIGSGISLFILAGVAQKVLWDMFSPVKTSGGSIVGVIPALIMQGSSALYRPGMPDVVGLVATFVVFLLVIWAYQIRIEVPIAHSMVGGQRMRYPIRLLYVSNVPIIFTSALVGDLEMVSRLVWTRFGNEGGWMRTLVDILGRWKIEGSSMIPVSGLAYYIQRPYSPSFLYSYPDAAAAYLLITVVGCILFAKIWVMTAGMDASTVAEQLVKQGIVLPGVRSSPKVIKTTIERYINAVTIVGGFLVGFLAAIADFTGALGTGSGILLAVTIIASFYEVIMRERALEVYPKIKRFLGG